MILEWVEDKNRSKRSVRLIRLLVVMSFLNNIFVLLRIRSAKKETVRLDFVSLCFFYKSLRKPGCHKALTAASDDRSNPSDLASRDTHAEAGPSTSSVC